MVHSIQHGSQPVSHNTHPDTSSIYYFHHGYPATLQPSRTGPLGIDHLPEDNFLAPSIFRFKHFMGACSSTTSYKPNHHSCPTPSLKLWGLDFFFYFSKKTTLQTQSFFINIAKQYSFYGSSIIAFCSLILGTISKDAHDRLESFRCQRWGLMTRTGRYVADLTSYNHVLIDTSSTAACYPALPALQV